MGKVGTQKMKSKIIYLPLKGRIGNQLFQYACARNLQLLSGENPTIVIDDSEVLKNRWENSLSFYNLPNVEYIHNSLNKSFKTINFLSKTNLLRLFYLLLTRKKNYTKKYEIEKRINPYFNKMGGFFCENGYIEPNINFNQPIIYLDGYFQSPKYFEKNKSEIFKLFDGRQFKELDLYPSIQKLRSRNSVCISIKVEHNVGSELYDVCSNRYWKEAIQYVINNIKDPLFFICSDNIDYVLNNLIDTSNFEYVVQDSNFPVYVTLAAMNECKNFIIGNTSYGWWAQYLSKSPKKLVIAPSKWMAVDMPIALYEPSWHLIKV